MIEDLEGIVADQSNAEASGLAESALENLRDFVATSETIVGAQEGEEAITEGALGIDEDFLKSWGWFVGTSCLIAFFFSTLTVYKYVSSVNSQVPRPIFHSVANMIGVVVWEASYVLGSDIENVQWIDVKRNARGGIDLVGIYQDLPDSDVNGIPLSNRVRTRRYTIRSNIWGRITSANIHDVPVPPTGRSYTPTVIRTTGTPSQIQGESTLSLGKLAQLSYRLYQYLTESQLRILCSHFGMDYEELQGDNTRDKARKLVLYLDHRQRILELLEASSRLRPDVSWSEDTRYYYQDIQEDSDSVNSSIEDSLGAMVVPSSEGTTNNLHYFTDVSFPEQCRIHEPVPLTVQLTLKPPTRAEAVSSDGMASSTSPLRIREEPDTRAVEEQQAELIVFVSADSFGIDRRWQNLSMPFGRDSKKIEFNLIGQKLGLQIAEIELFHGTARVGYVVVETQVVEDDISGNS
jgi:hypothetical protein